MSQLNTYENICEFAIAKFRESIGQSDNEFDFTETYNFPHWKEITQKVLNVWTKNYSDKLKIYQDENQIENLFNTFRSSLLKIMSKRSDYHTYRLYIEHVIDYLINEIKRKSFGNQLDQKENIGNNENKLFLNPVVKLDPLGTKLPQPIQADVSQKKREILKKIYQYEIDSLMRAHSKESNINDNSTPVTDAAFELSTEIEINSFGVLPKYTNLCATCGHNIINIIDTDNGKILKRFNDDLLMNRNKESFNCLAWTNINNLSILAAAGTHGQIKIIVPKYSSCFARIDAHTMPITCLLFHYQYPNIILSASEDNTIKIWRLDVKEGSNDLQYECNSELLNTIQIGANISKNNKETIFSMCFVSDNYLIISTSNSIYGIKLDDNVIFNQEKSPISNVIEEKMSNEEVIAYMTTQPKTKENLVAEQVKMFGVSFQNIIYEESIVANKILFYKNVLFANLLNSNLIYLIDISIDEENSLVLKVIGNFKIGESKATEMNSMNLIKDNEIVYLTRSACDGIFYFISLDDSLKSFSTMQRYLIPTDYTIKAYSDPARKTNIKNYGLLEKASVIKVICNGTTMVSTTNQNMVIFWKKSRVLG